jgi:thioredoxin
MKKLSFYIFFSALFSLSGMTIFAQTEKKPELLTKETFKKKVWNYEASPNEVKYLGDKPCVIDFYADWCGWCKKIAPFMNELCNTYDGEVYFYKVNADQNKDLQALFQIKGLPTVLLFPMKGQPTAIRGAVSKEQYDESIKQVLLNKK